MGGGSSGASAEMDRQQKLREQRVKEGLQQINAVFSGGTYGTGKVSKVPALTKNDQLFAQFAASQPGTTWFDASGKVVTPGGTYYTSEGKPFVFNEQDPDYIKWRDTVRKGNLQRQTNSPGSVPLASDRNAYMNYLAKQGKLFSGATQAGEGFTDEFFANRAKDYENFALPQLGEQFTQTQRGLTASLANRGILNSSSAVQLANRLRLEGERQRQGVVDQGLNLANALRSNVEQQRQNVVNQLYATGDPNTALQSALGTTAALRVPGTYAPLNNMFQNWSNLYLANQVRNMNPSDNPYSRLFGGSQPLSGSSANIIQ